MAKKNESLNQQNIFNSNMNDFENVYKDLHFYGYNLFCILGPDRIAASAEFGFIAPSDNENWKESIVFFPEYAILEIEKKQKTPCVYVKVPLEWARFCEMVISENLTTFISTLDSLFPFSEVIEYYIPQEYTRAVDAMLHTYNFNIAYTSKVSWKLYPTKTNLQAIEKNDYHFYDKLLGGVSASCIEEIYGKLIDEGKIYRGSRYIEPFTCYDIFEKNDKVNYDYIIPGHQGFSLIFSMLSFLEYENLENIGQIESFYIKQIIAKNCSPLMCVKPNYKKSIIWYIPIVIKHYEDLKDCNASLFLGDLQVIMAANKIENSVENQWAIALFAVFCAKAISGDMWDNAKDGISKSLEWIKKLKESVTISLFPNGTDELTSPKVHNALKFLGEVATLAKRFIADSDFMEVVSIPKSFEKELEDEQYLFSVTAALCVLWATNEMSKDWYNVFNRAFNGNVKSLNVVFPILGAFMGFFHGYKKLRRRKNYNFSNSDFLERLIIKLAKTAKNSQLDNENLANENSVLKTFPFTSATKELKIVKFSNGFEFPVIEEIKGKENEKLKNQIKDMEALIKLLDKQKETESEITNILKRYKIK